ncbi:MAG: tyrosinase family protein, partial [Pseudolabrys sp.]
MAVRQNVANMSAADLDAFRNAIATAQGISDNRGYTHFAGLHGWPGGLCKHGDPLFPPWHRAYLYMFEMSLRDLSGNRDIAFPWWDWTSDESHQVGVPAAYADTQSPLAGAEIPLDPQTRRVVEQQAPNAVDLSGPVPRTIRNPNPAADLPQADMVEDILDAPTFDDFTMRLEDVHNSVHGRFNGSMAIIPLAAFDPIFWAHHTMVDRLWYLWQLRHPGSGVPAS